MKKTLRAAGLFSLALATLIGPAQIHAQCVGCSQSAIQQPVFSGAPIQSYQSWQSVPVSNSYQTPMVQSYNSQPVVYGSSVNTSTVPAYNNSSQVYSSSQAITYPASSVSLGSSPTIAQTYPTQVYSNQGYAVSQPTQVYPSQSYSAQSYPVQSYPTQTYAAQPIQLPQANVAQVLPVQTYPTQSYPMTSQTYASNPVVSQPIVSQPAYTQTYANASYSNIGTSTLPTSNYSTSNYGSNTYTSTSTGNVSPGLAQQKAVQAAQMGLMGHVGGGLGGAKYEGVGWSNVSPQHAIQKCCYWGTRPTAQIGVTKGANGLWYACVLYH